MLTFTKENHEYKWDGNPVGSVTQIIREFVKVGSIYVNVFTGAIIPAHVFEAAGDWGTDVHSMLHYHLDGDLDMGSLSPALEATLNQFLQWMDDYEPEIMSHEERLYSKKYNFAGTYDLKCKLKGKTWIVDYKTGAFDMAGPQIAAYVQLDKEAHKGGVRHRAVLYLPKNNGGYKFIPMTGLNDWQFFLSRLNTYNYTNTHTHERGK